MIEVSNLVKMYEDTCALNEVSFSADKGQIVGLLGPNGAGKSTTMNIMTGYIAATSGTVKIGDYDIENNPIEVKSQIGYLPELPPLYKDMTVREYLEFVAELKYKKCDKKAYANEVMEKTNITLVENKIIKKLSKGYQQRVGIAAALIGNPPVLILDEPMVGLDPAQTKDIRELIKSLSDTETIIISSHILSEINELCDHIVILSNGKVKAIDTTKAIINKESSKEDRIIKIIIKGKKDKIEKAIEDCKNIDKYQINDGEENNLYEVVATSKAKEDVRDDILTYLNGKSFMVYGVYYQKMSLEDVFIELTEEAKEVIEDVKASAEDINEDEETTVLNSEEVNEDEETTVLSSEDVRGDE